MRRRKKRRRSPRRFPRLVFDRKLCHYERKLHKTYNELATKRDIFKRQFHYDVYRTRIGARAKIAFLNLAESLKSRNVKPELYMKIMSRYGKYKESRWMPHPTWLAKDVTIEKFAWKYRSERRCYDIKLEFEKAISGWSDLDIYASIRDSAKMLRHAIERTSMTASEARLVLAKELSPWFLAVETLQSKDRKDYLACLDFLRKNQKMRNMACRAFYRE